MSVVIIGAGASRLDMLNPLPPSFADRSARPIDEQLWTYTARRPVGEWVFANAAERERNITVERGVRVAELIPGRGHRSNAARAGRPAMTCREISCRFSRSSRPMRISFEPVSSTSAQSRPCRISSSARLSWKEYEPRENG